MYMKGHLTVQGFVSNAFEYTPGTVRRRPPKYIVSLLSLSAADETRRRSTGGACCGNAWSTKASSVFSV